ncbi:MAG: alpha/beta hydrolase [Promethearchaeota archaeon]
MTEFVQKFLDDPQVVSRVFYPQRFNVPKESKKLRVLKFEVEKHVTLGGLLFLDDEPNTKPTMMYFHGNGEVALHYEGIRPLFHQAGVNLAVFDFRAYGFSTGNLSYTALLTDPIPLYHAFKAWMEKEYPGKSAEEFILMGRSLGSACASALGAYTDAPAIKKVVFESGYSSTFDLMTRLFMLQHPQITEESLSPFSNKTFQKQITKPTLILHGGRDTIIPVQQGQEIFENIPSNVPKQFIRLDSATHNNIMLFGNKYFGPLGEFIQKKFD